MHLDTCPAYILDTSSAHMLASHLLGSQANMWPGVSCDFPGPCGAQMHRAASQHPVHTQRARIAPASPALHHGVVTVSTSIPVTKRALLSETCGFEQQRFLCLMSTKADSLVYDFCWC